jgi:hypothetical protein
MGCSGFVLVAFAAPLVATVLDAQAVHPAQLIEFQKL